ncbi:hypothetical protein LOTGIDRAFT_234942 [Lottia gigantea]|uniref:F-box domain-containing protein n=1 Tax=Lottia gigantea TaxID=225164 RepID=V4A313_LOTGI|nr:hypothetical protein LOTGIDRAFT_234942 [Lottia gigantea]ESO87696.1 hypothetical protein LOTGIDRAFT_234942 [Lottia gigantea]
MAGYICGRNPASFSDSSFSSFDEGISYQASKCHILDLPDELLVRIFGYFLPVEDRLPSLGLVCRKWKRVLSYSGSLWRILYVNPTPNAHIHYSLISTILKLYGHHVHKLIWRDNSPVYESIFSLIQNLVNLKHLRLPILWNSCIVESLKGLKDLEAVQLNGGFSLVDSDLEKIAEYFPKLREVSLNACWGITSSGVVTLFRMLENLQNVNLKINSGLPLEDPRSEDSMREGARIVLALRYTIFASMIGVLCLHFVPIEMDELWDVVNKMTNLKKLSISNCENLHGIRLVSDSLQKVCLYNLWNVLFVSIDGTDLRNLTIDGGMESMEHLEIYAPKLRRAVVNGSNILRTVGIRSKKLSMLEMSNCEELELTSFRDLLKMNSTLMSLKLGCVSQDSLLLDELIIPNLQELCLLGDFSCEALHIRSPTLRLFHTESETDIITLNHVYITANHLCKVAMVGMPALKTMTVQCVSVDSIELNLCSDDQLLLDSCIIQALGSIGFLRLFDCKLNLLSVSTPLARTVVLYRCHVSDYVLQMALNGCPNISNLNLEKCKNIKQISIEAPPLKFLNMFGCRDIHRLDLDCPELIALNIGQCPNVRLFIKGIEQELSDLGGIVMPSESVRWSHDFPPQVYMCS